jgi:hypothetical protein
MNLMQTQLLKAKGYVFSGTQRRGSRYVAIAIKNGKRAEASGRSITDAEHRLVASVTAPGEDRNVEQWRREEQFLRRMQKRYDLPQR